MITEEEEYERSLRENNSDEEEEYDSEDAEDKPITTTDENDFSPKEKPDQQTQNLSKESLNFGSPVLASQDKDRNNFKHSPVEQLQAIEHPLLPQNTEQITEPFKADRINLKKTEELTVIFKDSEEKSGDTEKKQENFPKKMSMEEDKAFEERLKKDKRTQEQIKEGGLERLTDELKRRRIRIIQLTDQVEELKLSQNSIAEYKKLLLESDVFSLVYLTFNI